VIFNYRLTDSEVQVRLGSWVVRRIRLDDIETAAVQPWSQALRTWNEHWSNFSPSLHCAAAQVRMDSNVHFQSA
jgi:hypothetical protein